MSQYCDENIYLFVVNTLHRWSPGHKNQHAYDGVVLEQTKSIRFHGKFNIKLDLSYTEPVYNSLVRIDLWQIVQSQVAFFYSP